MSDFKTLEEMEREELGAFVKEEKKSNKKEEVNIVYTSYFETRDFIYEQVINAELADVAESRNDQTEEEFKNKLYQETPVASFVKYDKKEDK